MKAKQEKSEKGKKLAALEAVKHVKDNFVIGLGSGSTAAYAIEAIGERIKKESLNILAIPTSYQAFHLAVANKIPITTLEEASKIDVTIDGADQINRDLDLIKGMGAALVREKIVASASIQNLIIADESKKVEVLGEHDHPVPLEVLPFAISTVKSKLLNMDGDPILREGKNKVGPVITDNGNVIIDTNFGPINNPADLENKLRNISGIVDTGLFIGTTTRAYIGRLSKVETISKK